MCLLFAIDTKDYDIHGTAFIRPSARCIAIRKGKVAMIYSRKFHYFKFPGGGMESGESYIDAMIRETREEAGLTVIPDSVREYGYVHRIQKSDHPREDLFIQDNFYYLCRVERHVLPQQLDRYEAREGFILRWVNPQEAIRANRSQGHGPKDQVMLHREARVLEMLVEEGYFSK